MRDDQTFLRHIRDAIGRILEYTRSGRDAFLADTRTQDAVIRNFEVIGEAAKNHSQGLVAVHPEIPWRRLAGFRDVLIHHYFGVKVQMVWQAVEEELPRLLEKIGAILAEPTQEGQPQR